MLTNDVRVEIYRSFVEEGRAPSAREIAGTLDADPFEVENALRRLAADDVIELLAGGGIWLAHPFCAVDAAFEVRSGDRRWDAICIWDGLGILALVGIDGDVSTRCPDCDEPIVVRVRKGAIVDPKGIVHYGVPASAWYEDVAFT